MVFLGATDSSYFCYFIYRVQPGSYYTFSDSVYICRFSNFDNKVEETRLIRATTYKEIDGKWVHQDSLFPFDITHYLAERGIHDQFPSDRLDEFGFLFANNQLHLTNRGNTSVLLDSSILLAFQDSLLQRANWMTEDYRHRYLASMIANARVVEYFKTGLFYYFVIRTGLRTYDNSYFQFIAPVPTLHVDSIIKQINRQ